MKEESLTKFYKEKTKIQIVLKNGRFFTGTIVKLSDTELVFLDKFNNELPFDLSAISYVDIVKKENETNN